MPINMSLEYPKLQSEYIILKMELEAIVKNNINALRLAMEFGYKQSEKGNNLETAFINFDKTINSL